MKTTMKKLATATLMLLAVATVQAQPIVLPDPAAGANESGTFTVANNAITLTGNPISLTTAPAVRGGNIASGSARFTSGDLQYSDGASSVDGQVSKVSFGSEVKGGQVVYTIKGLVFGKLTQAGQLLDVSGNFSISTKAAAEATTLAQAQVDSSHLVLTIRSNVNNIIPANPAVQQHSGHDRNHSKH